MMADEKPPSSISNLSVKLLLLFSSNQRQTRQEKTGNVPEGNSPQCRREKLEENMLETGENREEKKKKDEIGHTDRPTDLHQDGKKNKKYKGD
jgi:hypothetical protein